MSVTRHTSQRIVESASLTQSSLSSNRERVVLTSPRTRASPLCNVNTPGQQ